MNILAVIVARGNSKRLPKKNLKKIGKYPLVYWTCIAAKKSMIKDIVVSTEDKEIANVGEKAGIKRVFWRPKKLTRDYTKDLDIIFNAVKNAEKKLKKKYDIVCYMQPTTPFLRSKDIGVNVHYIPIYKHPFYKKMGFRDQDFPYSEKYYDETISIPIYTQMTKEIQSYVMDTVIKGIKKYKT